MYLKVCKLRYYLMNNEIARCRTDFGLITNIYWSAVGDGVHQKDRYLPGEIVSFSIQSSETRLCRIESSFNSSNHSGRSSLGPVRMCWKEKAPIHAIYLQCMYVSSALCTIPGPKLSGWGPICITLCCLPSCLELPSGSSQYGCFSASFLFAWDMNTLTFWDIAYCAAYLLLPFVWIHP